MMCSDAADSAATENDHAVCGPQGRSSVRDQYDCGALSHLADQCLQADVVGCVELRRRFVESEYRGMCNECSSDRNSLSLSARQRSSSISDRPIQH
jgi:hypothetical protein